MTMITLSTVWINLADDPSQFRSFPLMSQPRVVNEGTGSATQHASGRRRLVVKPGGGHDFSLTLPQLDRDQIAWLDAHVDELVLVRDDRGRKVWGTYNSFPVEEVQGDTHGDASLAISEVTHTEVV